IVNMSIIMISGSIIPPPEGADTTTTEGLKAAMHLFEPKHFLLPFLAHALGTLVGAFVTDRKSTRLNSSHVKISYAVFCLKHKITHAGGLPELPYLLTTADAGEVRETLHE